MYFYTIANSMNYDSILVSASSITGVKTDLMQQRHLMNAGGMIDLLQLRPLVINTNVCNLS